MPTSWTRPLQLGVAAWFGVQALYTAALGLLLYRDRPVIAVYAAIALVWVAGAVASFQGRLRMFWIARTWFGLVGLSALINARYLLGIASSPFPSWVTIGTEAIAIAGLGLFIWLWISGRRYGPWAMKKPGP